MYFVISWQDSCDNVYLTVSIVGHYVTLQIRSVLGEFRVALDPECRKLQLSGVYF